VTEPLAPGTVRTHRLEGLSDAVFAIAATLLVLDIVPEEGVDLLDAIVEEWPSYLAYIVSFASVGAFWLEHNVLTQYLTVADAVLVRINLLHLLLVAFLPFPTHLVGEHISEPGVERIAVTVYGLTLLAATATLSWMWRHATRHGLLHPDTDDAEVRALAGGLRPGMVSYAVLIVVGFFVAWVAVAGYFVLALRFLIPVRAGRRQSADAGDAVGG
jgi:uncharacterized membrane protein